MLGLVKGHTELGTHLVIVAMASMTMLPWTRRGQRGHTSHRYNHEGGPSCSVPLLDPLDTLSNAFAFVRTV